MDSPAVPLVSAAFKFATSAVFKLVVATGKELFLLIDAGCDGLLLELNWDVYDLFNLFSSIM